MLSIKKRKQYLKYLGYFNGKLDNKNTADYRKAVLELQKDYFPKKYQTGKYAKWTEILLRNAVRVKQYTKDFKLEEFKCECGGKYCSCYPALLNINLLKYIQKIRTKYGSTTITSGLRCEKFNDICGGASFSKHMDGKALDFVNSETSTFEKRKTLINWYIKHFYANYAYCYKYGRTKYQTFTGTNPNCNYPEMGNAVHIDVK